MAFSVTDISSHDFSSTNQSLSGIFDSVYSAYDLGKKTLVSPEQLTAWCVAAPGASASGSGSAHKKSSSSSSGQKSGKKSSTSSSSVASSAGSISSSTLSSGASSGREGVYGNSVWNIVHQVEEVERMVLQE